MLEPAVPFEPFPFDIQPLAVPLLSTIALAVRTPTEGHSDTPLNSKLSHFFDLKCPQNSPDARQKSAFIPTRPKTAKIGNFTPNHKNRQKTPKKIKITFR